MRMSEIFNMNQEKKKKKFLFRIGLFITGLLSLTIILVTIYGQSTGTFIIGLTREAANKGISISEYADFRDDGFTSLQVEPLNNVNDMVFSMIDTEAAEASNGQYVDPEHPNYIAYTFYLKNIGEEVVDLEYRWQLTSEYKGVSESITIRMREFNEAGILADTEIGKNSEGVLISNDIVNNKGYRSNKINNFRVGEIRKFTFYLWFDGNKTDREMMGGAIKLSLAFAITSGEIQ